MFEKLKKKFSGVLTLKELEEYSFDFINEKLNDKEVLENDPFIRRLNNDSELFDAWHKEYKKLLPEIANSNSKKEQILKLRHAEIIQIENYVRDESFFLNDEFSEEEKELLMPKIEENQSYEFYKQAMAVNGLIAKINMDCLRYISQLYSDASDTDWFSNYYEIYTIYIKYVAKLALSEAKGEEYLPNEFILPYQSAVEEAKKKILGG